MASILYSHNLLLLSLHQRVKLLRVLLQQLLSLCLAIFSLILRHTLLLSLLKCLDGITARITQTDTCILADTLNLLYQLLTTLLS